MKLNKEIQTGQLRDKFDTKKTKYCEKHTKNIENYLYFLYGYDKLTLY